MQIFVCGNGKKEPQALQPFICCVSLLKFAVKVGLLTIQRCSILIVKFDTLLVELSL